MKLREQKIREGFTPEQMPEESVIIAALMHDLCKADVLRYSKTLHRTIEIKNYSGHSARSVRQVGYSGFILTPAEKDAILMHMGGKKQIHDDQQRREYFKTHPLSDIIHRADGKSIGESKRRHHPQREK